MFKSTSQQIVIRPKIDPISSWRMTPSPRGGTVREADEAFTSGRRPVPQEFTKGVRREDVGRGNGNGKHLLAVQRAASERGRSNRARDGLCLSNRRSNPEMLTAESGTPPRRKTPSPRGGTARDVDLPLCARPLPAASLLEQRAATASTSRPPGGLPPTRPGPVMVSPSQE